MIPLGLSFVWVRHYLDNRPIEWVPYSSKSLGQNLDDGRIVLVNFSASWDLNTLYVERSALETTKVKRYIRSHRVVPLRADYTELSAEIQDALGALGQRSIPVVAIYSASSPDDPIVLPGLITKQQVLNALETANAP